MATIKKISYCFVLCLPFLFLTFLLLALTGVMMVGFDNNGKPLGYTYIELDSCEYISGLNELAHKGNCRFCKEHRQKELKEFVEQLKEK